MSAWTCVVCRKQGVGDLAWGRHEAAAHPAAHTPGPWAAMRIPGLCIVARPNILIASMADQDDGELAANSALIAAAPDLLEALEDYLRAGHKEARREASVKAKAAIRKARGQK